MKNLMAIMALVLGIAVSGGAYAANLVINGDFETGDFTGWTQFGNTGYTGVSGGIAFLGPVGSNGYLFQDVATTPGQQYTFSFDLGSQGGTPSDFVALVDPFGTPSTLLSLVNPSAFAIIHFAYLFTATDVDTVFGFKFRNDPGHFMLDNVTVEAVAATPIPPALLLFASALGGLSVVGWKRRKSAAA